MEGDQRRLKIIELLNNETKPLSGSELSKILGVSRQIIVQDIALLRANNYDILSTTKGYLMYLQEKQKPRRGFLVKHTNEEIRDELETIVKNGGRILNVIIAHDVYGTITVDLIIDDIEGIDTFVKNIEENKVVPLMNLTKGVHIHTVEAESYNILDNIEKKLADKKYLLI